MIYIYRFSARFFLSNRRHLFTPFIYVIINNLHKIKIIVKL
nr:MAG TPA: hypothetical protein [Caudoviricetes sp.]